jgi:hypothetical protein
MMDQQNMTITLIRNIVIKRPPHLVPPKAPLPICREGYPASRVDATRVYVREYPVVYVPTVSQYVLNDCKEAQRLCTLYVG